MSVPQTRPESLRLLSQTPLTATAYAAPDGLYTQAELDALGSLVIPVGSFRSLARLQFVGTDAADENFNVTIRAVERITNGLLVPNTEVLNRVVALGSAVVTLGNYQVADTAPFLPDYFFADTIAWTASTYASAFLELMYARTIVVHTPADDTPATLGIPDLGNIHALIIDFDIGTAAAMNALYSLGT